MTYSETLPFIRRIFLFLFFSILVISARSQKDIHYYLSNAIKNSPLLKDYYYQIQANQFDSLRLRAGFGPQVNANSMLYYAPVTNPSNASKSWGYDAAITNIHMLDARINVSKNLPGRDNIKNQYRAIGLQMLGLGNQEKISEQDLKRNVTQQYITAYGDLLQFNFNQDMMRILKEEEGLLKKLTEKNVYKQTDYLSFLVTLQQQELVTRQWHLQYQNDLATLNYTAGLKDTAYTELIAPVPDTLILPDLNLTVFFQQFTIDSLKIITSNKQIDFNYRPKVNIFADGGYNSSFAYSPYRNFGFSTGITLTVPIYDGKQRKLLHQKNAIAEQSRQAYRDFYCAQYYQQTSQLQQQLFLTRQLIEQTSTQVKYADGLIQAQRRLLVTGDARIADYILAIGNYLSAKNSITQNTINLLQLLNQINYWNRKQ